MDLGLVLLGVRGVEGDLVARLQPADLIVEFGDDRSGSDLVGVVVGAEAVDRLSVLGPLDVDDHHVPGGDRTFHLDELGVLTPEAVDVVRHVIVIGMRRRDGEGERRVLRHDHLGTDLDGGGEGDRPVLLAADDVDLGLSDDVDVVFAHGIEVELGQGLLDCLGPGVTRLDPALEDPTGHLARPKSRNAGLAGDGFPRLVDRRFELRLVDGDR